VIAGDFLVQNPETRIHTFLGRLEAVRCAVPLCFRWDAFGWLAAQCERKAIRLFYVDVHLVGNRVYSHCRRIRADWDCGESPTLSAQRKPDTAG
jgi:hypothetical protein